MLEIIEREEVKEMANTKKKCVDWRLFEGTTKGAGLAYRIIKPKLKEADVSDEDREVVFQYVKDIQFNKGPNWMERDVDERVLKKLGINLLDFVPSMYRWTPAELERVLKI